MNNKSIVPFIKDQFPSYLVDSNSLFPDFLEAYYEWTNKEGNYQKITYDISNLSNIDESFEQFKQEFISEYLDGIPEDILVDKTLLGKKVSELYKAKGTPKAVAFLIKILFNVETEIFLPSTQIFKPSAAKWNRDISIRFVIDSGVLTDFGNFSVILTTPENKTYDLEVKTVTRVIDSLNVFEAILDLNFKLELPNGAKISTNTFTGTLVKSAVKKTIVKRGIGFDVGEIYQIQNGISTAQLIKVTKADSNRGLVAFDIIQYGDGFITDFFATVSAEQLVTNQLPNFILTSPDVSLNVASNDGVNRVTESLLLTKYDYTNSIDYFEDNTYVGAVKGEIRAETTAFNTFDDNVALIFFELGYILSYPGYYSDNVGFLDDASYIQDGRYYQQYSYVAKTEVQFDKYENIAKSLVHPAGLQLFGEYTITNNVDVIVSVVNQLNILKQFFDDFVSTIDNVDTKIVMKQLDDVVETIENSIKVLNKNITIDNVDITDEPIKSVTKTFQETTSLSDEHIINFEKFVTEIVNTLEDIAKTTEKTVSDTITTNEITTKALTKQLEDVVTTLDVYLVTLQKVFTEVVSTSETFDKTYNKSLNEIVSTTETTSKDFSSVLSDNISISSDVAKTLSKVFEDTVSIIDIVVATLVTQREFFDNVDITDTQEKSTSKPVNEVVSTTENTTKTFDKDQQDVVLSENSGVVFANEYYSFNEYIVEGTYWDIGYMNTEQTFTQ